MNFRSFYLFSLPPSSKAPSAQIMNDGATQSNGIFIAVYIFQWVRKWWSSRELTFPELGSTLGRVMVVWKGLSSTPSRSGAGAELGEATVLQAVANNPCALLLSGSLPYPEGRSWWTDVLSRGFQLQLDLSSLLGCSHHQHVSACGSQVSWLFLSPSSPTKQHSLVGLQTLSACSALSGKQQCAWPSLGGTQKRPLLVPSCLSFCTSLSSAVRWGKCFQTPPGRFFWTSSCSVPQWGQLGAGSSELLDCLAVNICLNREILIFSSHPTH